MPLIISIVVVLIFIVLLIIGLDKYEKKMPKLEVNDSSTLVAIDNWLEILHKKGKFNGAVYCKIDENQVLKKSYGYNSHLKTEKIDFNTKFDLASVSKQFTALGIMVLVKKFNVSYDDLVSKYIQEFPYKKVTLRHLLNQTSGVFVDYMQLAKMKMKKKDYVLNNKDAVALICSYPDSLITEPLEVFFYNNSNYVLLARIIELVSSVSYEEYMKKFVFGPLNLKETIVWNLHSKKHIDSLENVALGFQAYFNTKPIKIKHTWIDGVAGDGAVFSSLNDLIALDSIWYQNDLFSETELLEAYKKPILNNGDVSKYGFGWVIQESTVWHNGKWLASNSVLVRGLENKKCFILLDNSSNPRFEKIQQEILNTITAS